MTGTPTRIVREVDRARRVDRHRLELPDLRLRRPHRRAGRRAPQRPLRAGAAQGARLRAAQREPQVGAAEHRAQARLEAPAILERVSDCPPPPPSHAPAAATSSSSPSTASPTAATASRAVEDGYVVFVAGAVPGDRVRAVVGKSKRAYAEARAVEVLEPSPDRIAPVADHPGAPWQVLPYERQLEVKQEQVDDALTRIGRLEGYELEPIVPARRAVALPQQARVLVRHRRRRRARVRLPRARPLGPDRADRRTACSPPSAPTPCASRRWPCCRAPGPRRLGPAHAGGLPAQPRRPRGPPHRRAAGPPRHLARQARRRRADRRRSTPTACSGPRPPGSARAPRAARRRCSPARRSWTSSSATCAS